MKIVTGKIIAGQIVVEEMPFDEGSSVTIISHDESQTFELTSEEEAELLLSLEEAERGETISAQDLLESLNRPR
ncbi:hypothetical protein GTP44_20950 [Duganella sp. FT50W]|uniref:Uncharacterized protein n=1 Tax=Duganella lactea TaxID=2692173 RepID=A0A6L8MR54_9BURK|nr:hypothetical protein [Duganella lactea]MYM84408.1 hypothetical protein [Duganella lactea]